jgi:monoterpene epsilon-lactone hydrolase
MYSKELEAILETLKPGQLKGDFNIEIRRERLEDICKLVHVAPGVECRPVKVGEIPAEIVTAPGAVDDKLMLYLHGGSYLYGSLNTHRELASRISRAAGAPVLLIALCGIRG